MTDLTPAEMLAVVRLSTETPRPAGHVAPSSRLVPVDDVLLDTLDRRKPPSVGTRDPREDDEDEDDDEDDPPPEGPAVWTEIARTTSTVRVENPEDPEQYVDVERVETALFRLPDQSEVELRFNHG